MSNSVKNVHEKTGYLYNAGFLFSFLVLFLGAIVASFIKEGMFANNFVGGLIRVIFIGLEFVTIVLSIIFVKNERKVTLFGMISTLMFAIFVIINSVFEIIGGIKVANCVIQMLFSLIAVILIVVSLIKYAVKDYEPSLTFWMISLFFIAGVGIFSNVLYILQVKTTIVECVCSLVATFGASVLAFAHIQYIHAHN